MEAIVGQVLGAALTALAGWGVSWLNRWLRGRVEKDTVDTALRVVEHAVTTAVREVEQTVVPTLRQGAGRPLSEQARDKAKRTAVDRARTLIGDSGIAKVEAALGLEPAGALDMLRAKVEATVHELKSRSPLSEALERASAPRSSAQ